MKITDLSKYQKIPLGKLVKADWNYKDDDAELLSKLVANLKRNGQVENLLVRELPTGFFEIVNGNHRFDALKQIDAKEAICFNLGKISDAAAKRIAIETNETRFQNRDGALEKLLAEITGEFSLEELLGTMPYNEEHLVQFIAGGGEYGEAGNGPLEDPSSAEPRDIYVKPGDLIELGRRCYGVELNPIYCQVIIDRYADLCKQLNKEFVCTINGKPIQECEPVTQN